MRHLVDVDAGEDGLLRGGAGACHRCAIHRSGRPPALDLAAGYVQRALATLPVQGTRAPWRLDQEYLKDLVTLRFKRVDDPALAFTRPVATGARASIAGDQVPGDLPDVATRVNRVRTSDGHRCGEYPPHGLPPGQRRAGAPDRRTAIIATLGASRSGPPPSRGRSRTVTAAIRTLTGERDLAVRIVACLQTHGSRAN